LFTCQVHHFDQIVGGLIEPYFEGIRVCCTWSVSSAKPVTGQRIARSAPLKKLVLEKVFIPVFRFFEASLLNRPERKRLPCF
jgi:hypothetical protein